MTTLIISPDTGWSARVMQALLKHGMSCESAHNGKTAQLMAYQKPYEYFIVDVEVQNNPVVEVCLYIKKNLPKSKVIVTASSLERLKELLLDEKKVLKLGVSKLLINPSDEKLVHVIHEIGNIRVIKFIKEIPPVTELFQTEAINDQNFTRITVNDLFENHVAAFDYYQRIEPHTFRKVFCRGERITGERIRGVSGSDHLFFLKSKRFSFISYQNDLAQEHLKSSSNSGLKVIHALKSATDKFIEEYASSESQPHLIEEGKILCQNLFEASSNGSLKKYLNDPEIFNPANFSHTYMALLFTTLISKDLDWAGPKTVETLSLGALLHDTGISQLPKDLQDIDPGLLSHEQSALYNTHPTLGAEALKDIPHLNTGVIQIVLQHHEKMNGSGFPGKLAATQIYPLAKIVSLADGFSYHLKEHEVSPGEGLASFLQDQNSLLWYDQVLIMSLIKAIK